MIERERIVRDTPDDPGGAAGFLSRWSRRKLGREPRDAEPVAPPSPLPESQPAALEAAEQAPVAEAVPEVDPDPIDPRTGKRYSELTDEDMPPLETLDQNSDLSMFLARNVSNALRMKALTRVFHTSKFNQICICAEYAEDYTNFTPLGDIVPHDLKQAIAREAGKLYERLTGKGFKVTPEEVEKHIAASMRGESVPDLERVLPRVEPEIADAAADDEAETGTREPSLAAPAPESFPVDSRLPTAQRETT